LERRALGIVKPPSERRTNPSPGVRQSFVELPTLPSRRAEHVVELEDGTGRKLTVKVVGGQLGEVLPLAQAFWRPGV
jgi:hypothetical protein